MSTNQGSKLANTFYTLFTLEVLYFQYLLKCPLMVQSILKSGPRNIFTSIRMKGVKYCTVSSYD